jgi:hypothetical protein
MPCVFSLNSCTWFSEQCISLLTPQEMSVVVLLQYFRGLPSS